MCAPTSQIHSFFFCGFLNRNAPSLHTSLLPGCTAKHGGAWGRIAAHGCPWPRIGTGRERGWQGAEGMRMCPLLPGEPSPSCISRKKIKRQRGLYSTTQRCKVLFRGACIAVSATAARSRVTMGSDQALLERSTWQTGKGQPGHVTARLLPRAQRPAPMTRQKP